MPTAMISAPVIELRRPRASALWLHAPLFLALALRIASTPTANISYLLIAAYALLGRAHAIRALAMSWLFTMLSPGIAPEAGLESVGRYAILFAASGSAFIHSRMLSRQPRLRSITVATLLLGLFLVVHSLMFSPIIDVSVLKAISWTLAMSALISAWAGLSIYERHQVEDQIFAGLALILVFSLPMLATSLGYLRNGSGFQGILNHPQAFGPAMALLGAWSAARMLSRVRPSFKLVALAGASAAMVILSEARTAGFAMIGSLGIAMLLAPSIAGRPVRQVIPGLRSSRVWAVLGMLALAGLSFAPELLDTIQYYLTKSGRAQVESLAEIYDRSRGGLIEQMMANITEHPFTGIGFGIASEPWTMTVTRDPILGLPTGASIEKGVTPLMVLEELGIFGAFLVGLWFLWLLRSSARSGLAPFAVCLATLLLNMGESTLFSPGGLGLIMLILLGWAQAGGIGRGTSARG